MAQVTVDFSGTTVFVAGGTSGINLGIAEGFAAAGARVAVMSRSPQKVDAAVKRLQALGAQATGEAADVRDPEATNAVLRHAHASFGDIDVLVSGAAGNFPAAALDMSPNAFRSVVDIDLLGSYHVLRGAYPLLRKPGAVVINVSAPQALLPMGLQAHVCAAKAGVDMLTRVLAIEWGGDGIRVNSVVPGPIEGTEGMLRLAPTHQAREIVRATVPAARWGTPRDVADVCLFLASPLAAYVTGVVLPADGGWSLGGASTAMTAIDAQLATTSDDDPGQGEELGIVVYDHNAVLGEGEFPRAKFDDVVEGDHFAAWVTVAGSFDYDTQIGGSTTATAFLVDRIKVLPTVE